MTDLERPPASHDYAEETVGCEHCGRRVPIGETVAMVDCDFCLACYDEWLQVFHACQHEWEPERNEHGEPGRYCRLCTGFLVGEPPCA